MYPYGAPLYALMDHGKHFVVRFLDFVSKTTGAEHYLSRAYHTQTNGQTTQLNKMIVQQLGHSVADHRTDWEQCLEPLAYF